MNICFLGLDNLPVLAPEYNRHRIGGEQVQHTLLARALARRGHRVGMVVYDYGQPDGACWDGVMTWKAYRERDGVPVLRFLHPRWTGLWSALRRADADLYYASCAGMLAACWRCSAGAPAAVSCSARRTTPIARSMRCW